MCCGSQQDGSERDQPAEHHSDVQSNGGGSQSGEPPPAALRTFDGFILWYKDKVQQLAPLLVQAQFDSGSHAGQQVEAIWHEVVSARPACSAHISLGP